MLTYYIPESKFYTELKSVWDLCPEMNWGRVICHRSQLKMKDLESIAGLASKMKKSHYILDF